MIFDTLTRDDRTSRIIMFASEKCDGSPAWRGVCSRSQSGMDRYYGLVSKPVHFAMDDLLLNGLRCNCSPIALHHLCEKKSTFCKAASIECSVRLNGMAHVDVLR